MQKYSRFIFVGVTACLLGVVGTLVIVFGTELATDRDNKRNESVDVADFESNTTYDPTDYEHLGDYEYFSLLYLTLSDLSFSELIEPLSASQKLANNARRFETQQAIVRKMVYLDPEEALANISLLSDAAVSDLITVVFAVWSHIDFEAALKKASVLTPNLKQLAWQGILLVNEKMDLAERVHITDSLDLDIVTDDISNPGSLMDFEDHESSWNSVIQDELPNYVQVQELVTIAESWFDQEGFAAIDQVIDDLDNSWDHDDWGIKQVIVSALLYHSAVKDREGTFEYALSLLGGGLDTHIVSSFFQRWVRTEPREILDLVSTLENRVYRYHMQDSIISTWADSDPKDLLEQIESLPSEVQRNATALVSLAASEPKTVIDLMPLLSVESRQSQVGHAIAESWADKDPLAALEWVLTDPYLKKSVLRGSLLSTVLDSLAETDPELAMDTALEQSNGIYERNLISSLAERNMESAIKLLSRTREGWYRINAYALVGLSLIKRGELDRAFKLGDELTENEVDQFQNEILKEWSRRDPWAVYDSMSLLRSKKLQSIAAYKLISNHRNRMTKEQQRDLESYLTDEQRQKLK